MRVFKDDKMFKIRRLYECFNKVFPYENAFPNYVEKRVVSADKPHQ